MSKSEQPIPIKLLCCFGILASEQTQHRQRVERKTSALMDTKTSVLSKPLLVCGNFCGYLRHLTSAICLFFFFFNLFFFYQFVDLLFRFSDSYHPFCPTAFNILIGTFLLVHFLLGYIMRSVSTQQQISLWIRVDSV